MIDKDEALKKLNEMSPEEIQKLVCKALDESGIEYTIGESEDGLSLYDWFHLFISLPEYGNLFYEDTLLWVDEPLIFTCKNNDNQHFFVIAEPEDPGYESTYLIMPISDEDIIKLKSNELNIREFILNSEVTKVSRHESYIDSCKLHDIPEEYLPEIE